MAIDFNQGLSSFQHMAELIAENTPEQIISVLAQMNRMAPNVLASQPMGGYSKGKRSGAYYFVLWDFKLNLEDYIWFYRQLRDSASIQVFENLMRFRLVPNMAYVKAAYDGKNPQYFDRGIVPVNEDEVFVDCGAFTGDTAASYMKHMGKYKKMFLYEPSSDNVEKCRQNLKDCSGIVVRQAGIGRKNEQLLLSGSGSSSSFAAGSLAGNDGGAENIQIVSLDEDIQEPVSFIKMDVECFEVDGIMGARRHIASESPKLAICLYHIVSDLWEIPKLIYALNPNYQYYIRHYQEDQNWETVLYCIRRQE